MEKYLVLYHVLDYIISLSFYCERSKYSSENLCAFLTNLCNNAEGGNAKYNDLFALSKEVGK